MVEMVKRGDSFKAIVTLPNHIKEQMAILSHKNNKPLGALVRWLVLTHPLLSPEQPTEEAPHVVLLRPGEPRPAIGALHPDHPDYIFTGERYELTRNE